MSSPEFGLDPADASAATRPDEADSGNMIRDVLANLGGPCELGPMQASSMLEQMARLARLSRSNLPFGVTPERASEGTGATGAPHTWKPELRYKALVEKMPAITFMAALDEAVHELYISPQIEALLGFSQKEWLENPFLWFRQLHPEDQERWAEEFARTCATGVQFKSEYRLIARDGRVVWVHGECQLVQDEAGGPLFLQGIAFDITESKRAEEALQQAHDELDARVRERTAELAFANDQLRDSEARLTAILNTAADGILTVDERGGIEWLNPAALAIFGYTAEELVGCNVNLLMPGWGRIEASDEVAARADGQSPELIGASREMLGRRRDGASFPIDLSVSEVQLVGPGPKRLFTGIVRDITARRRAEQDLRAAKEAAEVASQAKDRFLAVLSHELRTPLTPVLAVVCAPEPPGLSPEMTADLQMIRRNIELETRLIDDLLDLTRVSRGKLAIDLRPLDAHDVVRRSAEVCMGILSEKRLHLRMRLEASHHHVRGDFARLQQVFWNLLRNAIKFTSDGGSITLRSRNRPEGELEVSVCDSGVGIQPELLTRVFDPFEQGGDDVTRRFGGLGLGLSISKGLVELHGGKLFAASAGPQKGSTFTVELPTVSAATMDDETMPAPAAPTEAFQDQVGVRILLVEDHMDSAKALARLLGTVGHKVVTANTIAGALKTARSGKYDLLISDIGLPDGTGLELMRQLRVDSPICGIALSGYGMADDVRRSIEAGFTEHLTKPVNMDRLEESIARVTAGLREARRSGIKAEAK